MMPRRRDASLEERVAELEARVDALARRIAPTGGSSIMDDALDAPAAPSGPAPVDYDDAHHTGGGGDVVSDL